MNTILNPLYIAVSWVISTIHGLLSPIFGEASGVSWSVAIIGLVVIIRIILIPLFVKQIKSQRALTALQPHMKEIQKKYKDDRQKQSEEMMKLYKEHKTNPLASCFPILAQAPIFFALFTVLNAIGKNPPEGIQQPTPPPPPPVLPGIPNLSKEQNEGIRKLQISLGQNILPIENEIREKDARLNTLTTLKDPDMKSIYALMDEIGVLKIKIAKMQMAHDMDIRKILNDEQRLIFDKRPKHPIH